MMVYHQANLGCKSSSISEDLVETIVALTLNIAKLDFCMILWLMMMRHHTKFDRSEILSGQIFTEVQNLHYDLTVNTTKQPFHKTLQLMNMHCQTKLVAKKSTVHNIIEIVMISLNEPKLSYCDLDLEDSNPFSHMILWLIMMYHQTGFGKQKVQRFIRYHPNYH